MHDRSIVYPEGKTIFWKEFASSIGLPQNVSYMGHLLNKSLTRINEEGEHLGEVMDYAYVARSIMKLQSLGVLQCDIIMTLGTTSLNNIDRFHITFFGQKLLEYIDINHTNKESSPCPHQP